jgi:DNA-binding XRE family transcriptional regulator
MNERLREERYQLDLSQQQLADLAGVSRATIVSLEWGNKSYGRIAYRVLRAINTERQKHGLPLATLGDLGIRIWGKDTQESESVERGLTDVAIPRAPD